MYQFGSFSFLEFFCDSAQNLRYLFDSPFQFNYNQSCPSSIYNCLSQTNLRTLLCPYLYFNSNYSRLKYSKLETPQFSLLNNQLTNVSSLSFNQMRNFWNDAFYYSNKSCSSKENSYIGEIRFSFVALFLISDINESSINNTIKLNSIANKIQSNWIDLGLNLDLNKDNYVQNYFSYFSNPYNKSNSERHFTKINLSIIGNNRLAFNLYIPNYPGFFPSHCLPNFFNPLDYDTLLWSLNGYICSCYTLYSILSSIIDHPLLTHIEIQPDFFLDRANARFVHLGEWINDHPIAMTDVFDNSILIEEAGLNGIGQIITTGDAGLDWNHCDFFDPEFTPESSLNLFINGKPIPYTRPFEMGNRKIIAYWDLADRVDTGHGTHTLGSMIGKHIWASSISYSSKSHGISPNAKALVIDLVCTDEMTTLETVGGSILPACYCNAWDPAICKGLNRGLSKNIGDEFKIPVSDIVYLPLNLQKDYFSLSTMYNSYIHSESWGSFMQGSYSIIDFEIDEFTYNNPNHLLVFSSGNMGEMGYRHLNSPSTAKNALSVGASLPTVNGWLNNQNQDEYMQFSSFFNSFFNTSLAEPPYKNLKKHKNNKNEQINQYMHFFEPMDVNSVYSAYHYILYTLFSKTHCYDYFKQCSSLKGIFFDNTNVAKSCSDIIFPCSRLATAIFTSNIVFKHSFPDNFISNINTKDDENKCCSLMTYPRLVSWEGDSSKDNLYMGCCLSTMFNHFPKTKWFHKWIAGRVAPFSSMGPTFDNRIKPEVIALGSPIESSRAYVSPCDNYNHPDIDLDISQRKQMFGTSYAVPVVSSLATLVRQYFVDGYYPSGKKTIKDEWNNKDHEYPSGALIKAILINSAYPSPLNYFSTNNGASSFSTSYVSFRQYQEGFGAIHLSRGLYIDSFFLNSTDKDFIYQDELDKQNFTIMPPNFRLYVDDNRYGVQESHSCIYVINLISQIEIPTSLSITLTWFDFPSYPNSLSSLVNDLDLEVILQNDNRKMSKTYYGNGHFNPKDERDSINTVEKIIIPEYELAGVHSVFIYVKAYRIMKGIIHTSSNDIKSESYISTKTALYNSTSSIFESVNTESTFDSSSSPQAFKFFPASFSSLNDLYYQPYALAVSGPLLDPSYVEEPICSQLSQTPLEIEKINMLKQFHTTEESFFNICRFNIGTDLDAIMNIGSLLCSTECQTLSRELIEKIQNLENFTPLSYQEKADFDLKRDQVFARLLSSCLGRIEYNLLQFNPSISYSSLTKQWERDFNYYKNFLQSTFSTEISSSSSFNLSLKNSYFPDKKDVKSHYYSNEISNTNTCRWDFLKIAGKLSEFCILDISSILLHSPFSVPSHLNMNSPVNCCNNCAELICHILHNREEPKIIESNNFLNSDGKSVLQFNIHSDCFNKPIYYSIVDERDLHFKELISYFADTCKIICLFNEKKEKTKDGESLKTHLSSTVSLTENKNSYLIKSDYLVTNSAFFWLMWCTAYIILIFLTAFSIALHLRKIHRYTINMNVNNTSQ